MSWSVGLGKADSSQAASYTSDRTPKCLPVETLASRSRRQTCTANHTSAIAVWSLQLDWKLHRESVWLPLHSWLKGKINENSRSRFSGERFKVVDWLTVIDVVVDLQLGQLLLRKFVGTEVEGMSRPSAQHDRSNASQWPIRLKIHLNESRNYEFINPAFDALRLPRNSLFPHHVSEYFIDGLVGMWKRLHPGL